MYKIVALRQFRKKIALNFKLSKITGFVELLLSGNKEMEE